MNWKNIIIGFILLVVVTNLPMINKNFMILFDGEGHFRYSNLDASFTQIERLGFKDGSISSWPINRFIEEEKPKNQNVEVYRLYRINPLCFWRWSYYIFTSRNFKYKAWEEIEPNRTPLIEGNMWQDF